MNILSTFFVNVPKDVSLLETSYTLSLSCLQHPHLLLQGLHLRFKFDEPPLDMAESMNLCYEGLISHACQHVVDMRHIRVVEVKGHQVFWSNAGDMCDVEYEGCVDESLEDFAFAVDHPVCVGVVGHFDLDVLGWYGAAISVDDVEGDVCRAYIGLKSIGHGGLSASISLDCDQVRTPGEIESDRAVFCFCHTSSTSSSFTSAMAHPFSNLAYSRYLRSIFVVFLIGVDVVPLDLYVTTSVGNVPTDLLLPLRASWRNSHEGPQGVSWSTQRLHKDRDGVLFTQLSKVTEVTVVVLGVVTAADV